MIKARDLLLLSLTVAIGACSDAVPEPTSIDLSLAVAGTGVSTEAELQDALDAASASATLSTIQLQPGAVIALSGTVTHSGSAPLRIDGNGATLQGPAAGSALESTGGADLTISDLTVEGAAEHGIYVEVPGDRTGTFSVAVDNVVVRDNGFGGLWVDDQVNNSPASVSVRILRSVFSGNNQAGRGLQGLTYQEILALADKDGVRVNEGGEGDLRLFMQDSEFFENQADAIELDETGNGDVVSQVLNSTFNDNGDQDIFPLNEIPEGYEPIAPDDYDTPLEEWQGEGRDLEDGFDIDENDAGSVWASFQNVTVNGNEDEGIDLDETYDGSLEMSGNNIEANGNLGEGIKLTESEEQEGTDGDIVLNLSNVTANGARDGRGMRVEEFQAGDVLGQIVQATFDGNDNDGLRVDEDDDGAIDLRISNTAFTNNGGDGLQAEKNGIVTLINPVFDGNKQDINQDDDVVVVTRGR